MPLHHLVSLMLSGATAAAQKINMDAIESNMIIIY
jgi:hypothetical protein